PPVEVAAGGIVDVPGRFPSLPAVRRAGEHRRRGVGVAERLIEASPGRVHVLRFCRIGRVGRIGGNGRRVVDLRIFWSVATWIGWLQVKPPSVDLLTTTEMELA